MHQSQFNLRVPLPESHEVFLMNTLTDAQLIVSEDIAGLLDRLSVATDSVAPDRLETDEREALVTLTEHGFIVPGRETDREALNKFFTDYREDTEQLRVTVLTTLQCNFACDYCFQGDHGDYNKHADKMSLDESARLAAWIEGRLDELHPRRPGYVRPDRRKRPESGWKSADRGGRELRRQLGGNLSGAAGFSQRTGIRRQAREGGFQAGGPRAAGCQKHHPFNGRHRQAVE